MYNFYLCSTKTPHVALQSLSSIKFFSLVLLSTVEIGSLSNDENGKKQQVYSFFNYLQHVRVWLSHLQLLPVKQTIKKIPTGKWDGFKLLLQMNPCAFTTYLHNFT